MLWIHGCAGLSMGINIHIFIPGKVVCYGCNAIVLFVKIFINKIKIKNVYIS